MPLIHRSSYPGAPGYLFNGHLQTIVPSALRNVRGLTYERERLELSDGDFLDLDWVDRGSKRLVVITHGLEGDSNRPYVRGTAKLFAQNGWDALAWNCRSCSGEMNRAFRLYNHGEIGDIDAVIRQALRTRHYEEITLVGYSMGGNITLKYLGVHGKEAPDVIGHAAAFSAPTDLRSSAQKLDVASNSFYKKRFLRKLSNKVRLKAQQHPGRLDVSRLAAVGVWRDFDEAFSAALGEYRDADDFYEQASARNYMPGIRIPVLLVNALNDPILTPECAPTELAQGHPHIFLETPRTGGHVGFMVAGDEFTWAERRALEFTKRRI
ncbi:YheT family hydrolase [Salmonirosea aquatica]|uniref:Alpha/beta fold hydrolase n=1 Tax=Salmonirosea aquatica TaxID=2654236 RepID=A0A7C9BEF6_9BACT|nr:alpha/beta fold hydrolase [Cytophagaceae bacterium SJW1-29]